MDYSQIKKGMVILFDKDLYVVTWCQNHKPGKGGAVMRTKLKNVTKGNTLERVFRGGDKIEQAHVDTREAQLLYKDGDDFVFMDQETYEQYNVPGDVVGDGDKYLKEETVCNVSIYEDEIIVVEPPMFVELEITETDPGLKGDTVSGGSKPATVETGAVVQVPLFVNQGEKIKIDTREDRYVERVK